MPIKPLPPKLLERLKRLGPLMERHPKRFGDFLGRSKNIDPRKHLTSRHERKIKGWGRRVRSINTSMGRYGVSSVVVKRSEMLAKETIDEIKKGVRDHNQKYAPSDYVLSKPYAYALDSNHIAMIEVDFPNLGEILSTNREELTERGKIFFEKLKRENRNRERPVTKKRLKTAYKKLRERTSFRMGNLLLIGFEDGKFKFLPLFDLSYLDDP